MCVHMSVCLCPTWTHSQWLPRAPGVPRLPPHLSTHAVQLPSSVSGLRVRHTVESLYIQLERGGEGKGRRREGGGKGEGRGRGGERRRGEETHAHMLAYNHHMPSPTLAG